jgi:hypothetical protein
MFAVTWGAGKWTHRYCPHAHTRTHTHTLTHTDTHTTNTHTHTRTAHTYTHTCARTHTHAHTHTHRHTHNARTRTHTTHRKRRTSIKQYLPTLPYPRAQARARTHTLVQHTHACTYGHAPTHRPARTSRKSRRSSRSGAEAAHSPGCRSAPVARPKKVRRLLQLLLSLPLASSRDSRIVHLTNISVVRALMSTPPEKVALLPGLRRQSQSAVARRVRKSFTVAEHDTALPYGAGGERPAIQG